MTDCSGDEYKVDAFPGPACMHTPGIFVHRIINAPDVYKPIEKRTTRPTVAA